MWIWYFVGLVILIMALLQFFSTRKKGPFLGLKKILPQFNEEIGEELTPREKIKAQSPIETLSGQSLPFFETTLSLIVTNPEEIVAEWSLGQNLINELTEKYGREFWSNSQPVLRLYHTNAVPQPYHEDFPIDIDKKKARISLNNPGDTVNSELGVITKTGAFIPLAHSNDVIIPQNY